VDGFCYIHLAIKAYVPHSVERNEQDWEKKSTTTQWASFTSGDQAKWVDKKVCVAEQEMEMVIYFGMSNEKKPN
jgi:hypothetical protein